LTKLTRLNPTTVTDIDDHDRQVALKGFASEIAALEDSSDSGHTPRFLAYEDTFQDRFMPYPGGYIHVIVMSKLPGQNVRQILLDLSEQERSIIRDQLASVLEYVELRITTVQMLLNDYPQAHASEGLALHRPKAWKFALGQGY
jgi:hypothetical protein